MYPSPDKAANGEQATPETDKPARNMADKPEKSALARLLSVLSVATVMLQRHLVSQLFRDLAKFRYVYIICKSKRHKIFGFCC
jgi:hypothetical protein